VLQHAEILHAVLQIGANGVRQHAVGDTHGLTSCGVSPAR
jgi:hypothetical protein